MSQEQKWNLYTYLLSRRGSKLALSTMRFLTTLTST